MPFSIQTNVNALIAQENVRTNSQFQSQTIQRLTSGYRINQSGDDAAGLTVANKFRSDSAELSQGVRNANDGLAQLQIMDGGMTNIAKMLDRLKTLATQSASDTFTASRTPLNQEFSTLVDEIDRQAKSIGLDQGGSFAKSLNVFIGGGKGSDSDATITNGTVALDLSKSTVDAVSLGLKGMQAGNSDFDLSSSEVAAIVGDAQNTVPSNLAVFKFSGGSFGNGVDVKVNVKASDIGSAQDLVDNINTAIKTAADANAGFSAAQITASLKTDSTTGNQVLTFTSANTAFQVRAGDVMANALLGNVDTNGKDGLSLDSTVVGQDYNGSITNFTGQPTLTVKIEGGGLTSPLSFTVATTNAGGTALQAATDIQTDVAGRQELQAAGITVSRVAGHMEFTSARGDALKVSISGDVDNILGFGNFQKADATTITADNAFDGGSVDGNMLLDLSLDGGESERLTVGVLSSATADPAGPDTAENFAARVNSQILAAGPTSDWQKAGIVADVVGGQLRLTSTNGTAFRLGVTQDATANADLGFNAVTAGAATAYAGVKTDASAAFNASEAQGEYQLGSDNTANALLFSGIKYGSDVQSLTVSAVDSSGATHSQVVTLDSANATSIDGAIKAINDALGQGDSTVQKIAAVKVNDSGTEKIQFVSSLANFSVNVGKTLNGTGVTDADGDQQVTVGSTKVGDGGSLDISTVDGASAAVTAIADAVSTLGLAQAAVGKGQNQLNYAINLAQSQISSFASAEAQIRDADIASEAANLTKASVLQQATMAAMAQANSAPQAVLALLRG